MMQLLAMIVYRFIPLVHRPQSTLRLNSDKSKPQTRLSFYRLVRGFRLSMINRILGFRASNMDAIVVYSKHVFYLLATHWLVYYGNLLTVLIVIVSRDACSTETLNR